jgi:cytochrome b subunit of formate dehydrogenase
MGSPAQVRILWLSLSLFVFLGFLFSQSLLPWPLAFASQAIIQSESFVRALDISRYWAKDASDPTLQAGS